MKNRKTDLKFGSLVQLVLGILIILLINIIGSFIFKRFDLTSDKRFSLSKETKQMLHKVDDIIFFKVYLTGDFPPDMINFKRLRNATREMLDEFRAYNKNIQFEFVNPSESNDQKERYDNYQLLVEKGLEPQSFSVSTADGMEQKTIFPGAIVTYKGNETAVNLLELLDNRQPEDADQSINDAIQNLELKLATAIRDLTLIVKPKIAFIRGHGELGNREIYDIAQALSRHYTVSIVSIGGQLSSLTKRDSVSEDKTRIVNKYDAIIIAKPDSAFSEKDKFILDQYIMRGGKVLWLIDPVVASMDSLQNATSTLGIARDLNLDDLLFKYGVRVNPDLVMDLNSLSIPLTTGQIGNQPQIEFFPWFWFPVVAPFTDHPIVKNLNSIKTEFVSSIDTIKVSGVKKTILLKTSAYSRTVNTPALITLSILEKEPDERAYQGPPRTVAVLLEGEFRSNFENRIPPEIQNDKDMGFLAKSKPTSILVVSDGDVIRNQLHFSQGYPLPLGYDQYTGKTYGNKDFILNAIDYWLDDSGLSAIRSHKLKLRSLNTTLINKARLNWQIINTALPVIIVVLFGVVVFYLRKRKYTSGK